MMSKVTLINNFSFLWYFFLPYSDNFEVLISTKGTTTSHLPVFRDFACNWQTAFQVGPIQNNHVPIIVGTGLCHPEVILFRGLCHSQTPFTHRFRSNYISLSNSLWFSLNFSSQDTFFWKSSSQNPSFKEKISVLKTLLLKPCVAHTYQKYDLSAPFLDGTVRFPSWRV